MKKLILFLSCSKKSQEKRVSEFVLLKKYTPNLDISNMKISEL